jgi:hypothetical protein
MAEAGKNDGRLVFDCLSAVLLLLVAVLGEATVLLHSRAVLPSGFLLKCMLPAHPAAVATQRGAYPLFQLAEIVCLGHWYCLC